MHYMHRCYVIWCSFQCWGLRESPQTQEGLFRRARVLFWCLWIVTRSLIFYQTAPRLHRSTSLCWETGKKDLFPLKWLQVNSMLCNGALWFSVIKWVTWERKNLFQQLQHESCRTIRLSSEDHLSSICYRANAISWFLFSWFRFSFGDAGYKAELFFNRDVIFSPRLNVGELHRDHHKGWTQEIMTHLLRAQLLVCLYWISNGITPSGIGSKVRKDD